jgi:hypothetical protein
MVSAVQMKGASLHVVTYVPLRGKKYVGVVLFDLYETVGKDVVHQLKLGKGVVQENYRGNKELD